MALRRQPRHVVAIGASAGGLEALLALLPHLHATGTTRFILAQHMSRAGHTELVVRVLGRHAAMPIVEAGDGELVEPHRLYVIPAGFDGRFEDGRIRLTPPAAGAHSAPSVNELLGSVARAVGPDAVAVVLSGAGTDGLAGCREVRAHGGTVLVQAEDSSAIHGMAGMVQRAGLAHAVLSPEDIAARLNALEPAARPILPERHPHTESAGMALLLQRLSERVGVDFTQYRQGTMLRRMDRRREALHIRDMDEYIAHALRDEHELDVLHRMFMISWSWFYRDPEAWDRLRPLLAQRMAARPPGTPITAWVPGCATGEEAYTVAMLLRDLDPERPLHIIGTDINEVALAHARTGHFRASAARDLPAALRDRFLVPDGDGMRVSDALRSACTFRHEDALVSAPDGPLDLVSCRNLLIYMKRELHVPLMRAIHDRLTNDGLLMLGLSESVSRGEQALFTPIDAAMRIYERRHRVGQTSV